MTELGSDLEKLDVRAMPLPIANAIAELEAALNPHEERDRLVEVFRATLRLLGGLALAARIEAGPGPKRPGTEVDDRLARLRRQALTDGEWVGLTRELLRPWREVAGTHPLPSLVDVFVGKGAKIHDGLDGLLGMRKRETVAHGTTGTEEEARVIVAERLPQLADLLHALAPLWNEARIVVPLERPSDDSPARQRVWLLHGPTPHRGRWRVVDLGDGVRVPPGRPIVIDAAGKPRLSLEPVVLCERASPEVPEDLFFLDGREKKTAVFTAFPSMAEVRRKDVLEALERALAARTSDELEAPEAAKSPYLGLQSFGPDDAALFVGREKLVEDLTNRILANPWVTVTGASGSGKTSLLAAGVGPALHSRIERERAAAGYRGGADATDYALVMLRPGSDPMGALASKLDAELGVELDRAAPAGWARKILDWAAARRRVLVVIVDQAEELVTLCRDVERREAFGALLSDLTSESGTPVRVVLSLRVDFMAQLATIRSIGDRYQRATQVVTTPARDDLVRILVEPAARFGVTWEAGLAEDIADRVKDAPSALALVSFIGNRVWEVRDGSRTLARASYDALGGVEGALAAHADEVVASRPESQRRVLRSIFLRLVTADGTRDVVPRSELEGAAGDGGVELVAVLVGARLLTVREVDGGAPVVELAHESLLEHWPQIRAWRDEDTEAETHHARLRAATRDWLTRGKPKDALWRGAALVEHAAVRRRRGEALTLSPTEKEFVEKSERTEGRARVVIAATSTTLTMVVALFAVFAGVEWRAAEAARARAEVARVEAEGARTQADARATLAEARELVNSALVADDDATAAVMMGAAASLNEDAAAQYGADSRAYGPMPRVLMGHASLVEDVAFSPDDMTALTGSADGTARLWDARTGAERLALTGHSAGVLAVAYSPDGATVLTGSSDATARLWDAHTGAERMLYHGHESAVTSVAYAPDGSTILTGSYDGTARLWNAFDGNVRAVLRGHTYSVVSVAYSPNGASVLTASLDGSVRLWDARTGSTLLMLGEEGGIDGLGRGEHAMETAAYAPDGATILTGSIDGTALVWDAATGRVRVRLVGHEAAVVTSAFSPDGTTVATGSIDGTARIWDCRTGREQALLQHEGWVESVRYSADGSMVLTGSQDGSTRLWDARTGAARTTLRGQAGVQTVAYSRNGTMVLSGSRDGVARLWDIRTLVERSVLRGEGGAVTAVAYAPDSDTVLTGSASGVALVWDVRSGAVRRMLEGHHGAVEAVAYSPSGTSILTGSSDSTARLWDAGTGAELAVLRPRGGVCAVTYSPDGATILTGAHDGTAMLWDARTGLALQTLHADVGPGREIRSLNEILARASVCPVGYSPRGETVVTGAVDGTARIWDVQTGSERVALQGEMDAVAAVAYSPNGTMVLIGSWDGTARLWNAVTGVERAVLRGHDGYVRSVAWSPDGATVLSGAWDETARLWDAQTGAQRAILVGHNGVVEVVAFSPDGATILTGSTDGNARLWSARTGNLLAVFAAHLGRGATVAFSPDGATVLTGSEDGAARLWTSRVPRLPERTNLRVCRESHRVIASRVPLDPDAYRTFASTLWASGDDCAPVVARLRGGDGGDALESPPPELVGRSDGDAGSP